MTVVATQKIVDAASGSYLSSLRRIREKVSQKETEISRVVGDAKRGSDRRVGTKGGRLDAEDGLEEALLELTALKDRNYAATKIFCGARALLQQEVDATRLDLLASSPPFILKLEQALIIVQRANLAADSGYINAQTRWRSSLKGLMKSASDSIKRSKQLSGQIKMNNHSELALVSASMRLLSLHVNAWTVAQLLRELERIWLQAVGAQAKENQQFQYVLDEWETARKNVEVCVSTPGCAEGYDVTEQEVVAKIRNCQIRAGIQPKNKKIGWWKKGQEQYLWEELWHIERKVAPLRNPSHLAARYNLLFARCAVAGLWAMAVASYRSAVARSTSTKSGIEYTVNSSFSIDPIVYKYLLRAAKNAEPPQPHLAMLVLQEMRSKGVEPSTTHYNLAVSACARAAAAAASTSHLMPLEATKAVHGSCQDLYNVSQVTDIKSSLRRDGVEKDKHCRVRKGAGLSKPRALPSPKIDCKKACGERASLARPQLIGHTDASAERRSVLFARGTTLACQGPGTTTGAWRLALKVIADMRRRKVAPTEVTYQALVECCRCAGTTTLWAGDMRVEEDGDSTPADVYVALKEAGVPTRFCYQAGLENALKGSRRFPEYIAEICRWY